MKLSLNQPERKDTAVTAAAFQRLLDWLDQGSNSEGQKYLEMRRRLLSYFDRKNCAAPDDLADETLNRVGRRLEEEGGNIETETPARYCYITARFIFMEHLRETKRADHALGQMQRLASNQQLLMDEAAAEKELRHKCLDQCIGKLDRASREVITGYYVGKERAKIENRRSLAERLGITMNALSIRACRIRDKLELCVRECIGNH
jgi:DNA-directed RNA polymerase specialized sigma24 family protein